MARIVSDQITVPAGETPAYSEWGEVGSATLVSAAVTVDNDESADLWVQWADDTENPDEPVDVFAVGADPNGQHYHVYANDLAPEGAYVRVKGIAYGTAAGPCHVVIDAV